jgi:hypothetical protein
MRKASDISNSELKKSQIIRPDTVVSATSRSSDKTKKSVKTEKTGKSDSSNDGRTSKSGASDGETNNKTSILPKSKPSKSKSKSDIIDFEPRKDTTIKFEGDMYKDEKHIKKLDANQFIGYLIEFFDENEDIIMPPPDFDNEDSKFIVAYII